jgi:hypothetical protein
MANYKYEREIMETNKEHIHTKGKDKTRQLCNLDKNKNSISTIAPVIMRREKYIHTFILSKINILIIRKNQYKILLRKTVLVPNTTTSLKTTLAAAARVPEG